MINKTTGEINTDNIKIGIIVSKFNESITENLLKGALKAFENNGS